LCKPKAPYKLRTTTTTTINITLMTTITYPLTGLHCGACIARVSQALAPLAGAVSVTLEPMQAVITNAHADFVQLQTAVAGAGRYALHPPSQPNTSPVHENTANRATESIVTDATPSSLSTYYPLWLIVAYLLAASVLVQLGSHAGHGMSTAAGWQAVTAHETMRYFMAGFFIVFSFFKLLDVRAFATAYAGYDLLAARWHAWGLVYPLVELALGIAYLINYNPLVTNWATVAIMGFSALGVIRAVASKTKIQCACLGTVFQLPMSTVTIVEDVGMVLMAAFMLLR
jgi:copper chaperone CopZ